MREDSEGIASSSGHCVRSVRLALEFSVVDERYPITIRLESVEGEPIHGEEMFVASCEHFPELAMA